MSEQSKNLQAFLTMIAISEGTQHQGDRGYNVVVGSKPGRAILFTSYDDHPRVKVELSAQLWSTAAGRYQLLQRYFDAYRAQLQLPDFSPASQDAIAIQQIRERGALPDVEAGRFAVAVDKVKNIWASLPGAGYGQHENTLAKLQDAYTKHGGVLA